ncbi:MAG TPA: SurA N-terminal domain-containing protein [Xanthobacteraceae bacterium]
MRAIASITQHIHHSTNDFLMLRGLRTASSGWLGKTIMAAVVGLLVVAFGIWGIGDIFRGFTRGAVASVGSAEISSDQFRQLFTDRVQALGRQLRRPITPDQARAFGLDQQVLGQWLQDAALDQRARSMRLGISDAEVVRRITEDPSFRGSSGQFDPARFTQILRDIGYSEQGYVAEQRRETLRRQITSTVSNGIKPPNTIAEAANRYENEQRDIDYVVLTRAQAGDIPAPAPDVLAKYFDERKVLFRAPEYRKATVLAVTPEQVASTIEIAAPEVKDFYDKNITRFSVPERRQVQQILFPDKEDAHKAADRIAAGLSFDDLAKERNISAKDLDLGLIPKIGLADRKVADAAFALTEGQVSGAIDGAFGGTIVRVLKIEPGSVKPFADVEADIKKGLALDRAKAEVRKLGDKIDEEIGGGARLDEVAKKLNIPFQAIAAIDRSGRDPDGKPVDLPKGVDVLNGIFSAEVGLENDTLRTPDGGVVWYDLVAVTPSRERPLDEVKDQVETRWRDDETVKRLNAKAQEMVDKIKGGSSLADLAAADKLKVENSKWLKRGATADVLPANALATVFRTAAGQAASADGKEPTERLVFVVTNVTLPQFDPTSPGAKRIDDGLRDQMANDLYSQFVARVESDLGVSINQGAMASALGPAPTN